MCKNIMKHFKIKKYETNFITASIILIRTIGFSQTVNFTVATLRPNIIEACGGVFACGDINGGGHKDFLKNY